MNFVLSVKNLRKVFGTKVAVDNISFDLKEGEILGLLGPNGSGKTTTTQMLLGTLTYTSGSIFYFGKDFSTHRSEILQLVSFASAYNSLPWLLTVEQNLHVLSNLYGLNFRKSEKEIDTLLERFGMLSFKKLPVAHLSAGQVTRLMLVKAFFIQPKVILLDEPTASLDPEISREVCDFILEQKEKKKLSILFTSHKMKEVSDLCDRVIFLKDGQIIANDLPENLARSVSSYKMAVAISEYEEMKQASNLADENKFHYKVDDRFITFTIDENRIPFFLNQLSEAKISYTNLKIEEPSLEDYFVQIARKST